MSELRHYALRAASEGDEFSFRRIAPGLTTSDARFLYDRSREWQLPSKEIVRFVDAPYELRPIEQIVRMGDACPDGVVEAALRQHRTTAPVLWAALRANASSIAERALRQMRDKREVLSSEEALNVALSARALRGARVLLSNCETLSEGLLNVLIRFRAWNTIRRYDWGSAVALRNAPLGKRAPHYAATAAPRAIVQYIALLRLGNREPDCDGATPADLLVLRGGEFASRGVLEFGTSPLQGVAYGDPESIGMMFDAYGSDHRMLGLAFAVALDNHQAQIAARVHDRLCDHAECLDLGIRSKIFHSMLTNGCADLIRPGSALARTDDYRTALEWALCTAIAGVRWRRAVGAFPSNHTPSPGFQARAFAAACGGANIDAAVYMIEHDWLRMGADWYRDQATQRHDLRLALHLGWLQR